MTLIEVLFGISLVMIAFVGFFALFQVSIDIVSASKSRAGATALANERMEYIRSLSYSAVGTVNGIPAGNIPQTEEVTLNGTVYERRTLIQYVDDSADGEGASDENGITTDYKRAKVEMTWTIRGVERSYSLVSSIVPKGVESVAGGGTLSIQVFDALAQPVSSASVRIYNQLATSTVDVTTYTNASGIVLFPGTPTASGYQITVTKNGYSTAKTYTADSANPNPSPRHLSISTNQTTSASFSIDVLSALSVRTWEPIVADEWSDTFADGAFLASLSSTTVAGGSLTLTNTEGYAYSNAVAPEYLASWEELAWSATVPSGASALVRVYADAGGTPVLISDEALPGNSAGFTSSPVSLSSLSTSTYPRLVLYAELADGSAETSPSLEDWEIVYEKGPTPLPSIPFTIRGAKTIGTDADGASIYKLEEDVSTDVSGAYETTLEWDAYTLTVDPSEGYDVAESCLPQPTSVAPGNSVLSDMYLVPATTNSLLVAVRHATSSELIGDVSVRLYKTGVDLYATTTSCGQAFFPGLSAGTGAGAYSIDVSKTGYTTGTFTDVPVSGASITNTTIQ